MTDLLARWCGGADEPITKTELTAISNLPNFGVQRAWETELPSLDVVVLALEQAFGGPDQ